MSYCLFENTVNDLEDCLERINDDLSESEFHARERLVELAAKIIEDYRGKP